MNYIIVSSILFSCFIMMLRLNHGLHLALKTLMLAAGITGAALFFKNMDLQPVYLGNAVVFGIIFMVWDRHDFDLYIKLLAGAMSVWGIILFCT